MKQTLWYSFQAEEQQGRCSPPHNDRALLLACRELIQNMATSTVRPLKGGFPSSSSIASSSQNLLTMLKKKMKGKGLVEAALAIGFSSVTLHHQFHSFGLTSSLEKFQRQDLAVWEQWHPAARKSTVASEVILASQVQMEHRRKRNYSKTPSESASTLFLTQ